jgi:DNA-directed RNA polymerase subunit RPC12/RpoP
MPIRFRCAYCQQLMGIARRKAGTVVRCPKCAGQVVVPPPDDFDLDDQTGAADPHRVPAHAEGKLFEHSDFEKVFDAGAGAAPQVLQPTVSGHAPGSPRPAFANAAPPASAASPAGSHEYEAVPLGQVRAPARGLFLTSGVLAVVSALMVVLMGMAFFLGLLLGRSAGQ